MFAVHRSISTLAFYETTDVPGVVGSTPEVVVVEVTGFEVVVELADVADPGRHWE